MRLALAPISNLAPHPALRTRKSAEVRSPNCAGLGERLQVGVADDRCWPLAGPAATIYSMVDDGSAGERTLDRETLAVFIAERRAPLLAYIERQLGAALRRKIEPEDILQEVAADALRSVPGYSPAGGELFSWLCQLAERRIIDAHRRFFGARKRDASKEVPLAPAGQESRAGLIGWLVASMTSPSQAYSRNQREQRLHAALESLPPEHQELLRLRYIERMQTKEIARKLGKTDGAIRVTLTRLLRRLQEMLGPDEGP